jgi:hypothetical protein
MIYKFGLKWYNYLITIFQRNDSVDIDSFDFHSNYVLACFKTKKSNIVGSLFLGFAPEDDRQIVSALVVLAAISDELAFGTPGDQIPHILRGDSECNLLHLLWAFLAIIIKLYRTKKNTKCWAWSCSTNEV